MNGCSLFQVSFVIISYYSRRLILPYASTMSSLSTQASQHHSCLVFCMRKVKWLASSLVTTTLLSNAYLMASFSLLKKVVTLEDLTPKVPSATSDMIRSVSIQKFAKVLRVKHGLCNLWLDGHADQVLALEQ